MEPKLGLRELQAEDTAEVAAHGALRQEHLASLVSPMDDMWLSFADQATQHWLLLEEQPVGTCAVDPAHGLLGFHVQRRFEHRAPALLRLALGSLKPLHMTVATVDPGFLSSALDVAASVEAHTLMYSLAAEPIPERLDNLQLAGEQDLEAVVEFQHGAVGAPEEFLRAYGGERIAAGELWLVGPTDQLQATGELRVDARQPGIAQLGLIVGQDQRRQGLGSRLMCSLVERSKAMGLVPHCSTEVTNLGAQRAIERAGFRSSHRILRVGFAL